MNPQHRQSASTDDDLEVTAELPVLDVLAYEANVASAVAAAASRAASIDRANDLAAGTTDTWIIPGPSARVPGVSGTSEVGDLGGDENRGRLELNLQALSKTLREVEERLTRKGERLAEMERALGTAQAEREASEGRARALADELGQARAGTAAAHARIGELQKALRDREAVEETRRVADADARVQLTARNSQLEAEIAAARHQFQSSISVVTREAQARIDGAHKEAQSQISSADRDALARVEAASRGAQARIDIANRDAQARIDAANRDAQARVETVNREAQAQVAALDRKLDSQSAAHTRILATTERNLEEARVRAATYLEALQSREGRRSVFEDLVATLDGDVAQRDAAIERLRADGTAQTNRIRTLEGELQERVSRLSVLEKQVNAQAAALAQRAEQLTDAERDRHGTHQAVQSLSGSLAERTERIKVLEGTIEQQHIAAAQLRGELERAASERAQLVTATAALEAALKAAATRGDKHEAAAQAAQARVSELDALVPQRRQLEQLEIEIAAVRQELQTAHAALETAGTERNDHMARITASDTRVLELERRVTEQQDTVRQLQAEANAAVARVKELESDLQAAEATINRLESDLHGRATRLEELEKSNQEWRTNVEEARHAITDRDNLIQRLEQETANSAALAGHIQRSITRMDHGSEHTHEPAPEGVTRLLIRTDGETEVVHVLGRKTSVGRTPDNDLQIDAKFISRHHAVILSGPAHAIIEDLNSTNGVLVNNRRITRQPLKDGDCVMIGKTEFRFVVRTPKAQAS